MKREEWLKQLMFSVPKKKQVRMIVDTDAKNEADDQYAILHHLMTPTFEVRGIIATHFEGKYSENDAKKGTSMGASYQEVKKVLGLVKIDDVPVFKGSKGPISQASMQEDEGLNCEAVDFIIEEAMREDERPLFVAMQGAVTNLALAYQKEPRIADRLTAVWIGGGAYPEGGWEFNLLQDIEATNVLFQSDIPLWQIPRNVYSAVVVSIAELVRRVKPCGEIGEYLVSQLVELNDKMGYGDRSQWPNGETWCIGDQPTVTVFLQGEQNEYYHYEEPRNILTDMTYGEVVEGRRIRVYDFVDVRLTWEDFIAKLELLCSKYQEKKK